MPRPTPPMIGRTFGRATVIAAAEKMIRKHGTVSRFECLCECGTRFVAIGQNLRIGKTRSCGCLAAELSRQRLATHGAEWRARAAATFAPRKRPVRQKAPRVPYPRIEMTGLTFGRLTVVDVAGSRKHSTGTTWFWNCRCICERRVVVSGTALRSGKTRSCGCLLSDLNSSRAKHGGNSIQPSGKRGTSEYTSWCSAKQRCYNTNNKSYRKYGGRGITMCDAWRNDFSAFLRDMGRKPSPLHTIDRINNDGPYSPENARWATPKEQSCNTRRTVLVDGVSMKDFAVAHGVDYKRLHQRVTHRGESPHEAAAYLTTHS